MRQRILDFLFEYMCERADYNGVVEVPWSYFKLMTQMIKHENVDVRIGDLRWESITADRMNGSVPTIHVKYMATDGRWLYIYPTIKKGREFDPRDIISY